MTNPQKIVEWGVRYFRDEYIAKSGRRCAHLLIPGRTGSGKTTVMFWILEAIVKICMQSGTGDKQETVVWFDTNKSSESLTLLTMWPVLFLIPRGTSLDIKINPECKTVLHEYEIVKMDDPMNPWKYLRKGWINVICLNAYIIDPTTYSVIVSLIFKKLIRLAHEKQVITPMSIFIDEMQEIAPAVGYAWDRQHENAAMWMAKNMKMVRSLGIRIIGAIHNIYELRKGVRIEMVWQIPRGGATYDKWEEPRLAEFNRVWASLSPLQICIARPDRLFSAKMEIDYYPPGEPIEDVDDYIGEMIPGGEIDDDALKSLLKAKRAEAKPKEDKQAGALPCDKCAMPHEIEGKNLVCKAFMNILNVGFLRENGCAKMEAKA